MQIVIEIPEEYLDQNIIDVSVMPVNREIRDVNVEDKWVGFTVLPEKHGRIADMDEAIKCIEEVTDNDAIYAISLIEWACSKRTILEAREDGKE